MIHLKQAKETMKRKCDEMNGRGIAAPALIFPDFSQPPPPLPTPIDFSQLQTPPPPPPVPPALASLNHNIPPMIFGIGHDPNYGLLVNRGEWSRNQNQSMGQGMRQPYRGGGGGGGGGRGCNPQWHRGGGQRGNQNNRGYYQQRGGRGNRGRGGGGGGGGGGCQNQDYYQQQNWNQGFQKQNNAQQQATTSEPGEATTTELLSQQQDGETKKDKKRKSMSQSYPTRPWKQDDAERALMEENNHMKGLRNQSLIIRFPDPELSKDIVKSFHTAIDNVHFQVPSGPRYCFVQLSDKVNPEKTIKELEQIKFGAGKLTVEKKYHKDEEDISPEAIDPYTLYIGNLPTNIVVGAIKEKFPTAARIDIGFAQKMKNTRYAFIRYNSVEEAIDAYRTTHNLVLDSRSIIVRFRRQRGQAGLPGEAKPPKPVKEETKTKTKVKIEKTNKTEEEGEKDGNDDEEEDEGDDDDDDEEEDDDDDDDDDDEEEKEPDADDDDDDDDDDEEKEPDADDDDDDDTDDDDEGDPSGSIFQQIDSQIGYLDGSIFPSERFTL